MYYFQLNWFYKRLKKGKYPKDGMLIKDASGERAIPIIEAMNCDTAVITSNVTSMPEVAGDAALLVDPYSTESISNAMIEISENAKRIIYSYKSI